MSFRECSPDIEVGGHGVDNNIVGAYDAEEWSCGSYSLKNVNAIAVFSASSGCVEQQSYWTNLPLELLRNVLRRVESDAESWPARKYVVACSAVCRTWRSIIKELVKTPEVSGKLTFPISLKQPGPREKPMQCFIKRDKVKSMFYLYLDLSPARLAVENNKFLLAARKYRHISSIEYIISLKSEDRPTYSNEYVGKLRSNSIGTKFRVYDTYPHNTIGGILASTRMFTYWGSKQVYSKSPVQNHNVGRISYKLNIFGPRRPRRMVCTMHSTLNEASHNMYPVPISRFSGNISQKTKYSHAPLILQNKAPRWHQQLQCWCLNFEGRVTVASVKNFQFVTATEPNPVIPQSEQDKVLLQFGKIGKDIFTMDYWYPLSAYQAFAICLTSFGTKLACE